MMRNSTQTQIDLGRIGPKTQKDNEQKDCSGRNDGRITAINDGAGFLKRINTSTTDNATKIFFWKAEG